VPPFVRSHQTRRPGGPCRNRVDATPQIRAQGGGVRLFDSRGAHVCASERVVDDFDVDPPVEGWQLLLGEIEGAKLARPNVLDPDLTALVLGLEPPQDRGEVLGGSWPDARPRARDALWDQA